MRTARTVRFECRTLACSFLAGAVAAVLLGGTVSNVHAGSLFGAEGLGLPRAGYDLAARGAGSTATGVADPYGMSTVNPAGLGWLGRAQIYSGIFTENVWIRAEGISSADRVGGTRVAGLRAALPWPGPVKLAAGFADLTDGRFSLQVIRNEGQPDEYLRSVQGTGGVGQLYGEAAVPLWDRLSLGLRYAWVGGTLRESREDRFTGSEFTDTESILRTRLENGRSVVLGAQLRPLPWASFGGFYGWGNQARLKSLFRSDSGVRTEERLHFDLPPTFGGGASLDLGTRWQVAFDYVETRWSESRTSDDTSAGLTALDRMADDRHLGFGLRRLASSEPRGVRIADRTVWRAGFRWDELGLPERAEPIREWALTGGIGLPIQLDRGYIDGLLEVGRRGDEQAVGIRESFLRLGVGITLQEQRRAF